MDFLFCLTRPSARTDRHELLDKNSLPRLAPTERNRLHQHRIPHIEQHISTNIRSHVPTSSNKGLHPQTRTPIVPHPIPEPTERNNPKHPPARRDTRQRHECQTALESRVQRHQRRRRWCSTTQGRTRRDCEFRCSVIHSWISDSTIVSVPAKSNYYIDEERFVYSSSFRYCVASAVVYCVLVVMVRIIIHVSSPIINHQSLFFQSISIPPLTV